MVQIFAIHSPAFHGHTQDCQPVHIYIQRISSASFIHSSASFIHSCSYGPPPTAQPDMDDIYFRVEDELIMSSQLDKIVTTMHTNDSDSVLGGTTTNNSPVPTVTPSRESLQQAKNKKKTKKKKKKKADSRLVWKDYTPPSANPFAPSTVDTSTLPGEMDEEKEIQSSIKAMNNLRLALENEHKRTTKNDIYNLDARAADIWKLHRHFNIIEGTIPRGTYEPSRERTPAQDNHAEVTSLLEILHRGNIGDVLQFTSNKYGHMDSFYQYAKQSIDNPHKGEWR